MNFSTVPPKASISFLTIAKYTANIVLTSSGSADSDVAVKPTRSQNNDVTTLRSSDRVRVGDVRTVPHSPQNFFPSGFSSPHAGHTTIR